MGNPRTSRSREAVLGIVLLLIGLAALANEALPALIMVGIGGYLLWRQFNGQVTDWRSVLSDMRLERPEVLSPDVDTAPRQSGAEKVYAHALRAVEAAGLNPDQVRVLPVDIGLMIFRADQDPIVYRTHDLPDDADYVQPFVQLRLPTRAVGRIRFEIVDSDGQVLFVHEDVHQLERGRNLVTPSARLPIHDAQAMHRPWQLRITADGMPLATHGFSWEETDTRRVRRHMNEDGEISSELRATLEENRLGRLSLDDLLSDQDLEPPASRPQQRSRRA